MTHNDILLLPVISASLNQHQRRFSNSSREFTQRQLDNVQRMVNFETFSLKYDLLTTKYLPFGVYIDEEGKYKIQMWWMSARTKRTFVNMYSHILWQHSQSIYRFKPDGTPARRSRNKHRVLLLTKKIPASDIHG